MTSTIDILHPGGSPHQSMSFFFNFTTHQLTGVLNGDLTELIEQVTSFYLAEKLREATEVRPAADAPRGSSPTRDRTETTV